jgi:hypothetical protein
MNNTEKIAIFPIADRMDFNLTFLQEELLDSLWKAHIHSIDYALPLFEPELQYLSPPEAIFGQSWASLVDLIAVSLFPCNNTITNLLQNCLPSRILQDSDHAPWISDLSRLENRGVWFIDVIYQVNVSTNGKLENIWDQMMCTESGRAIGRKLLAFGLYRPQLLIQYSIDLIEIVHQTSNDTECGVIPPQTNNNNNNNNNSSIINFEKQQQQ